MWSFAPHGPLAIFWNLLLTRHATCRLDRCVSAEWNESFGFAYKGTDKLRLHVTCLDRDNGSTDDFMCKVRKSPVQKPSLAHPSIPGILLRVLGYKQVRNHSSFDFVFRRCTCRQRTSHSSIRRPSAGTFSKAKPSMAARPRRPRSCPRMRGHGTRSRSRWRILTGLPFRSVLAPAPAHTEMSAE